MRFVLTAILLFTTLFSFGQSFEGTLTYVIDIEVSEKLIKMGMTKESIVNRLKESWVDTIRITYKQGDFYTLMNGNLKSWTIYKADSNKIYAMQDGEAADLCSVRDASLDVEYKLTGKMPTVEKLDSTAVVNGVTCNIVRVKWNSATYDYYYHPSTFKVDASLFSKYIYEGWADFLKISNALPLKITKKAIGIMTLTMTLVASKEESVDNNLFVIPQLVSDDELYLPEMPDREMMRIVK